MRTRLSININKIATLRNARGGDFPNVLQVALDLQKMGAEGITVHPRPDQRHIRYQDVKDLKENLNVELNVEGFPDPFFLDLVTEILPAQVTLVPDPPHVLTSNAGWDTEKEADFLLPIIQQLKQKKIRVSLFIDTDLQKIEKAAQLQPNCIELYTENYAKNYALDKEKVIDPYQKAAELGKKLGLQIHAGHDLNSQNLAFLKQKIPFLSEVSIGHAFVAEALYWGFQKTLGIYQNCLK